MRRRICMSGRVLARRPHGTVRAFLAYASTACRSCTTHREIARGVPALRWSRIHAPRHAQKEIRDRAAVAMCIMQAHVHAGTGRAAQQDLPLRIIIDALTTYSLGYSHGE